MRVVFKDKKRKYIFGLSSFLVITSSTIATPLLVYNDTKIQKILSSNTYNYTKTNTTSYNTNTNWLNGNTFPTKYASSLNTLASCDGSSGIVTNKGYLGVDQNRTTLYFVSFSGFGMWALTVTDNQFFKNFYIENELNIDNVKIQQWVYNPSKNSITLLMGKNDGTNQTLITLDADSGLLFNPRFDNEMNITQPPIIKLSNNSTENSSYNRMYLLSDGSIIVTKIGNKSNYQNLIKVNLSTQGTSSQTITFSPDASVIPENDALVSIICGSNGYNFLLFVSSTPISSDQNSYQQYVVAIDNNFNIQSNSKIVLDNYYVNSQTTNQNTFMNFNCIYSKDNTSQNVYFITGNTNSRHLNSINFNHSNKTLTNQKSLSLSGNVINTIAYDSNFSTIYIGNKSSNNGTIIGYIDLSKSTLSFSSIVSSSLTTFNPGYVIPVKENLQQTKSQIILYIDQEYNLRYAVKSNVDKMFHPSKTIINLKSWNTNTLYSNIKSLNLVNEKMPNSVGINDVSSRLTFQNLGTISPSVSYVKTNSNLTYGTLSFNLNVSYPWAFDETIKTSFSIPIHLNGFYKINDENYNFSFIKSSNDDPDKWAKIEELKRTKFAKDITRSDVFNYFWKGNIKDKNLSNITINENMFSVNGNYGDLSNLQVTFTLPSNLVPSGYPSDKLKVSYTYSGFLSTNGYELSAKSDSQISQFVNNIYPSQLTADMILKNFINHGEKIQLDPRYWECSISNVDDFEGTVTISLKYLYESDANIPDVNNFPKDRFNVFTNKTIKGFKSIKSSINTQLKPSFAQTLESEYLPSEIWNQFVIYNENNQSNESIILQNLVFPLVNDLSDLSITLNNSNSCDADKFLDLNISIKDGAKINVDYSGVEYEKSNDNKLIFSDALLNKISNIFPNYYPYQNIIFNITTTSKYFYIVGPNGESIQQTDNVYLIDLKNFTNDFYISSQMYANDVNENQLYSLIKSNGYNYTFENMEINKKEGYISTNIKLELTSPPLVPSKNNFKNDVIANNNIRTLIIYNFKIPSPMLIEYLKLISICISIVALIIISSSISIGFCKKRKFKKMGVSSKIIEENKRKFNNLNKKYELTKNIINRKNKSKK